MKYLILLSLFIFCSCDDENSSDFGFNSSGACTLIGASNALNINFYKDDNLKELLAFSVNDSGLLFDDCKTDEEQTADLDESSFFYTAKIYTLAGYFPNGSYPVQPPTTNILNFKLYHRSSCENDLELFLDKTTSIDWKPLYPNGERCGAVGYQGTAEINNP